MKKCVISGRSLLSSQGAGVKAISLALRSQKSALYSSGKYFDEDIGVSSVAIVPPGLFAQKTYSDFQLRNKIETSLMLLFTELKPSLQGLTTIDAVYLNVGTSEFRAAIDDKGFICEQEVWINCIQQELKKLSMDVDERRIYLTDNVCSSSTVSIGVASEKIRKGMFKNSLIIAMDLVTLPILSGLNSLGALSRLQPAEKACRPFSRSRSGFVRAEALGMLLLEEEESARTRNADFQNAITGFGQSSDARHITAGCEFSLGIKKAISEALISAELNASLIQVVKAHGTGTKINDQNEARAIKELLPGIPVISFKGQFGHSAASSGLFETILCEIMLNDQIIYPSLNCEDRDPELEINIIDSQKPARISNILMNAFGFGGNNAVLVMSKCKNE